MRRLAIALVVSAAFGCKSKAPAASPSEATPVAADVRMPSADAALQQPDDGPSDVGWSGLSVEEIDYILDSVTGELREAMDAAAAAAAWEGIAPHYPTSVADLNKLSSTAPAGRAEHVGGRIRLVVEVGGEKTAFATFERTAECSDGFLEVPEHPSSMTVKHEPVWWAFPGLEPEQTVALSLGTRKVGAWYWNAERGCVAQTDLTAMLLGPEADAIDSRPREWPIEELGKPTAVKEWSWKVGEPPVTETLEMDGVPHQLVLGDDRWALLNGESQPIAEFRPKPKMPGCRATVDRRTQGDRVFVHLSGVAGEDDCHGEESELHEFGVLAEWRAGRLLVHSSGQSVSHGWTYEGSLEGQWMLRSEVRRWSFERETTGSEIFDLEPIKGDEGVPLRGAHCLDRHDTRWATKWTVRLDEDVLFSSTAHENLSTRFVDDCP